MSESYDWLHWAVRRWASLLVESDEGSGGGSVGLAVHDMELILGVAGRLREVADRAANDIEAPLIRWLVLICAIYCANLIVLRPVLRKLRRPNSDPSDAPESLAVIGL